MEKRNRIAINPRWISVGIAVIYGILARVSFGMWRDTALTRQLSWGFLTLVPLAIGGLSVFFAPEDKRYDYDYALKASFTSSLIFLVIAIAVVFEVFICILMAAPIFFIVSVIGGLIMCFVLRQ